MVRINIDIPDEVHERLKMIASAEGKGFYEWLKDDLTQTCPDEETLLLMLRDIRNDRLSGKHCRMREVVIGARSVTKQIRRCIVCSTRPSMA
jgi:hypothetical protein